MADYVLEWRGWVPRPRAEVFACLADPARWGAGLPWGLSCRVVGREPLAAGAVIDLRVRWLGLPLRWRTYVREWDPPARWVEVQVRGPWQRWEHRACLVEAAGGTWVEDRITCRPPLGPIGRLAYAVVLGPQLRALGRRRLGGSVSGPRGCEPPRVA